MTLISRSSTIGKSKHELGMGLMVSVYINTRRCMNSSIRCFMNYLVARLSREHNMCAELALRVHESMQASVNGVVMIAMMHYRIFAGVGM